MFYTAEEAERKKKSDHEQMFAALDADESKQKDEKQPLNLPNLYPIVPELQCPSTGLFVPTVSCKLFPFEIADTPEGRVKLAKQLAFMKQAAPRGTEIGVRINPKDGNPEVYARGENLNYEKFFSRMAELRGVAPITPGIVEPITTSDYINAKTNLTPSEQTHLIRNTRSALKVLEGLNQTHNGRDAIQDDAHREAELEAIRNTLQQTGLTNIPLEQVVATPKKHKSMSLAKQH